MQHRMDTCTRGHCRDDVDVDVDVDADVDVDVVGVLGMHITAKTVIVIIVTVLITSTWLGAIQVQPSTGSCLRSHEAQAPSQFVFSLKQAYDIIHKPRGLHMLAVQALLEPHVGSPCMFESVFISARRTHNVVRRTQAHE